MDDHLKVVRFFSMRQACLMEGDPGTGMISITDSWWGRAPLKRGWGTVLRLFFDDREIPIDGYKLFSSHEAERIIDWLVTAEELELERIYVHCHAGISRSAAVAKFIAELYHLPFDHSYSQFNKLVYAVLWDTYNDLQTKELQELALTKSSR